MPLSLSALPVEAPPAFLGVSHSLTGKLWRDRLDARGAARALAITQRYQLPEMLARVLAGRDVALDAGEDFLDPTIRKLMPDPYTVTQMEAAAKRIADAATLLPEVPAPVLVIIGKKDVQVDWQADGEPLQRSAAEREDVTFIFPDNANHVLKHEPRPRAELVQAEVMSGYNAPDAHLDPEAEAAILAWLAART